MSGKDGTYVARASIPFFAMTVLATALITVILATVTCDVVAGGGNTQVTCKSGAFETTAIPAVRLTLAHRMRLNAPCR